MAKKHSPLENILVNVSIFLLLGIIAYLTYSLYMRYNDTSPKVKRQLTSQVAEEIIQCEVKNGCGVNGVADRFTDYLRNKSFDVVSSGNYKSFDMEESIVIDRIGNMANAYKTAEILGIKRKNVIQQINEEYFLDVSVVIGKDYFSLKPLK